MKTAIVIFTFPRDYLRLSMALDALCIEPDADVFVCVESAHADAPLPHGLTRENLIIKDFDRGGNLTGARAVIGEIETFRDLANRGYDCIVKLDADTFVCNLSAFVSPIENGGDFAFIRRGINEGENATALANGCCYAMSARCALDLHSCSSALFDSCLAKQSFCEDKVISSLVYNLPHLYRSEINKEKICWGIKPYYGADCIALHNGYLSLEDAETRIRKVIPSYRHNATTPKYKAALLNWIADHGLPLPPEKSLYDASGSPIDKNTEFGVLK